MKTYVIENKDNERFEVDENELKDFLKQKNLRWSRLKNTWDGWERNDPRKFERGYKLVEVLDCSFEFKEEINNVSNLEKKENSSHNILFIPDLHEPFCLKGYREWCKSIYDKYKCTLVVFLGDIIDMHATSSHLSDPDGHSAGTELNLAKVEIKKWHDTFPYAKVIYGNHTVRAYKMAFSNAISRNWIKDIKDVLETPTWDFKEEFIINDILCYHGEGLNPRQKSQQEMINTCGAHNHSQSYINFIQGRREGTRFFSMQLGCGVDSEKYAFAYAKHGKPPHLNCGVVVDGTPIIEYFK